MPGDTEHFISYSTHPTCRIVIDTCSDVNRVVARRLGVDVIEFPFVMADGEHWDDNWETVSAPEFYGRMRGGERVMTSAIPVGRFVEIYETCAEAGTPTLYLSFTAGLSSSVNDAQQAAAQVRAAHPDFDLVVIDNRCPSLTASLLAAGACARRDQGMSMHEIADWCSEACYRIHGYFTLDSLKWLAAGGRIPKAAAGVSAVLNVKPNLSYDLDGRLTLSGVSRGRKKALRWVVDQLEDKYRGTAVDPVGIVSADAAADADVVEEGVRAFFAARGQQCPPVERMELDPTIGAHVGPGMVALAFWGVDRRK